jgi:hypothetical protein
MEQKGHSEDEEKFSDNEEQHLPKPSSSKRQVTPMLVKMKKFMSSKTASSSIGQSVIVQSLGDNGEEIFLLLKLALKEHFGVKRSEDIITDCLIIALKTKILLDEKILTYNHLAPAEKQARDFCFQAVKDLQIAKDFPGKVDVKNISLTIKNFRSAIVQVLEPFIRSKNLQKVDKVLSAFAELPFLDYLLNSAKSEQSRGVFQRGLDPMLAMLELFDENFLNERKSYCKSFNCSELEIKSKGLFKGMGYCAKHHFERFGSVYSAPKLSLFLDYKFLSIHLVDFLQNKLLFVKPIESAGFEIKESTPSQNVNLRASVVGLNVSNPIPLVLHYYYFHESLKQYEQLNSKPVRASRIKQLEKKFLNSTFSGRYVWLPDSIKTELNLCISQGKFPKTLYSRAHQFTLQILESIFPDFTSTVYYEKAVLSITLP